MWNISEALYFYRNYFSIKFLDNPEANTFKKQ